MASQNMTVGELSSFLMYTFWIGISIAGNAHMHTCAFFLLYEFPSFILYCLHLCDGLMCRSEFVLL